MKLDRRNYKYHPVATAASDSRTSIAEDFEVYKQYYSDDRLPFLSLRTLARYRIPFVAVVLVLLFIFMSYRNPTIDFTEKESPRTATPHTPMKSLGAVLTCDPELKKPSATVPEDVNMVRPADLVSIAALGDSITVGSYSKNFLDEPKNSFFGNSFVAGGDETLATHITLANVLREFNPKVMGPSHGVGYGNNSEFNMAIGGMTSEDLPRQAKELVGKMTAKGVQDQWKLINIFIGTNDIGNMTCYKDVPPIPATLYKSLIEKTISILRDGLPRTIVSITAMWNSPLSIEAGSIIKTGQRLTCGDGGMVERRDELCTAYRNAAYEIQNEKKFESKDFAVVVQGFMDDIKDAFRNKAGVYDVSFYADDVFHLSKYGNAVLGKFLWNGLLEPVGKKNTKADLWDDNVSLKCPDKEKPFIRTLGNS